MSWRQGVLHLQVLGEEGEDKVEGFLHVSLHFRLRLLKEKKSVLGIAEIFVT
jgi:hypothetical protein